ncbi:hypothetical protein B0H63DRAFT_521706 [Podospora didyma]|uniref:Methyltransferase type 11 domain-containing protein n=1 Tax=Podospora didyma TaxID=330526 RepID=A0AAE0NUB5_9PEZI|nr:hypothetical protein B0H63DRAFT_521706 [Podospora didyma]
MATAASSTPSTSSSLPSSSAARAVASLAAAAAASDHSIAEAEAEAEAYEKTHVHGVYEAIAPHFSATRYKPWPAVADFLHAQPPGAIGLDVGCGNGKYLGVNPNVFMLGSDRSSALVGLAKARVQSLQGGRDGSGPEVAPAGGTGVADAASSGKSKNKNKNKGQASVGGEATTDVTPTTTRPDSGAAIGNDVLVADGLSLPFRDCSVDFAICVAVIHHLSTRARRQDAIRKLLKCVRGSEAKAGSGKVLVYVWALEQGNSRRGWDEGGEQDLLVPWVLKSPKPQQPKQPKKQRKKTHKEEVVQGHNDQDAAIAAAADANKSGEHSPIPTPTPAISTGEGGVIAGGGDANGSCGGDDHTDSVFERYYHLYRKGELEEDVLAAGGAVLASGYERDNWWTVAANEPSPSGPA